MSEALWHDIECGAYASDLPLWHDLAARMGTPVLDVGSGTGRVTLDLARAGVEVIALDSDAELIGTLRKRAGALPITAIVADARAFSIEHRVGLVIVPMQTVQLLGGADGRRAFLRCARTSVVDGGILAMAIADIRDGVVPESDALPMPDMREINGIVYSSQALAILDDGDAQTIHRLREIVDTEGNRTEDDNYVTLDALTPEQLEAEGLDAGFSVLPRERVPETDVYIGSTVVMLGA